MVLALMAVAFVGGVVTGVVGKDKPPASTGVIDEAADRIAVEGRPPGGPQAAGTRGGRGHAQGARRPLVHLLRRLGLRLLPGRPRRPLLRGRRVAAPTRPAGRSSSAASCPARPPPGARPARRRQSRVGRRHSRCATRGVARVAASAPRPARAPTLQRRRTPRRQPPQALRLTRADVASDDVVVEHLRGDIARVQVRAFTRGVGREVRRRSTAAGDRRIRRRRARPARQPGRPARPRPSRSRRVFLDGGRSSPTSGAARRRRRSTPPRAATPTTPLVVLVDGGTASAAEVVTGALQDRNRAVVVGSRTYGKGSVQEPSRLSDGSAIELTVGRYLTPSGRSLDGVGIDPDVAGAAGGRARRSPSVGRSRCSPVWSPRSARHGDGAEAMPKEQGRKLIAQNKKARHDYHIEDTYEAGLVLTGTEVKSLRAGRASLVDGFAHISDGEVWLARRAHPGVHRGHVDQPRAAPGAQAAAAPRARSAADRQDARRAARPSCRCRCTSRTARPRSRSRLARGKKTYDKRQALAERQSQREMQSALSRRSSGKDQ